MNIESVWLSGLIGVIAPLIIRWITGARLSRRWKSIIAVLISAVIGFASAFLSGQFYPSTILKSIAVSFSISQVF
jgi:hypothetical protein